MSGFAFHSPLAFLLLLLAPLVCEDRWRKKLLQVLRLSRFEREKNSALSFSSIIDPGELPLSLRARYYAPILNMLKLSAYVFLVIALARPQTGVSYSETVSSGRDIMLVLDTSRSMAALDFQVEGERVERLTALKAVVNDFIRRREGDRIGLVVFGEEVFTQCPLTRDQAILLEFVDQLEIGMAGDATALGDGIAIALKRMRAIESESRVLVLVTDGLKTAGKIEPKDAAEIAKKLGVKIHSVGIGGRGRAPFKTTNVFGIETVEYKNVPLDEETLKLVSLMTGGRYFNAINTEELLKVYSEIDTIELRDETVYEYVDYSEHYWMFAFIGLLLALGAELSKAFYFRIFP